ncbi:MAG: sugar kinase [Bacteroidetes bacterium GWE2_41_25]|nr:MAG: sugar kinase [Bacteroidetes bacterium GWA2_40_15]OFX93864.1 MAG: sugar kinase [Bacteroidetes bacterium GWE2_41_25]OFX99553.1 MAG: sugar kinase [Bacteroidetes bacterium GWC2_40_22]OFY57710.1 MAG: sugar kinase [Bacteroidetes bacterium GWF2_41_9]HBH82347.1 sugar kinase [Bacteroidales bacterium]
MMNLIGIDIGGTKCAVILGHLSEDGEIKIIAKNSCATADYPTPDIMIPHFQDEISGLLKKQNFDIANISAIGISCGGPLDSKRGIILSPPNLSGWDDVHIVQILEKEFNIPVAIQNDANACALAEWKFGAGRGTQNMVFLTFGTGMGAGLILNGKLYSGTNDNAGEVGHIRLDRMGPVGYGKSGSFEGFCSGGGIAQLARTMALEKLQMGEKVSFCKTIPELPNISAQSVAEAANRGDALAKKIFEECGTYLGKGLSVIIDILNPECIVLGSIFVRSAHLLLKPMEKAIAEESLPLARKVCRIVPAQLEEQIGDMASLSVAANKIKPNPEK